MARKQRKNSSPNEFIQEVTKKKTLKIGIDDLKLISPLTDNQTIVFNEFVGDKNLILSGCAGSGKSFIALHLALREVLQSNSIYKKVLIIRSAVQTRDIGFLPGSPEEKANQFELPYVAICNQLFQRCDRPYERLKEQKRIEFISTSFIRGMTFNNCIVIVDEIENLSGHELDSAITRIGKNTKLVLCGDYFQSDLKTNKERHGLLNFLRILERMPESFVHIKFDKEDIVRSGLVKKYIITKMEMGIE